MKKIIIGNLKSYLNSKETLELLSKIDSSDELILAPSPPFLALAKHKFPKFNLASQDVSAISNSFGASTGEAPSDMLKNIGINYSIIGHSERRTANLDNEKSIGQKISNCLNSGITPIICIGESKEERENGSYIDKIGSQIKEIIPKEKEDIIIAYEPIWAIGTGLIPSLEEIEEVASYIIESTKSLDNNVFLVYGGSVNEKNAQDIANIAGIDGLLIGKASTDSDKLSAIIEVVNSR